MPSQRMDPYKHGVASGYANVMDLFLGPAARQQDPNPYSQKPFAKYDLPEGRMQNEFLRDTVEDWNFTANQTWYTERALPWRKTDNIQVQWNEWESDVAMMGITPHEAPSNIVTSKRSTRKATMVRRGIGVEFEIGFIKTELGRERFVASLIQIARAFQDTANAEVLRALLHCQNFQHIFERKFHIINDGELDEFLNREVSRFMIAQKEEFAIRRADTNYSREQEQWKGTSNAWILSQDVIDYTQEYRPENIYYDLGGPRAATDQVNSPDPFRSINGVPVFMAKSYGVDGIGAAELLSRIVERGIFNTMVNRTRDYRNYKTMHRNIRVFDRDLDDWVELSLQHAIMHCVLFDEAGDILDPYATASGRLPNKMSADSDPEGLMDFCRYGGSGGFQKQDIKYIGDLDERWVTQSQLEGAGWTLFNALVRQTADQGRSLGAPVTPNDVANIMGSQFLFAPGRSEITAVGPPETPTYRVFVGPSEINTVRSQIASSADAQSKQQEFLTVTLGNVFKVDSDKAKMEKIAADKNKSWQERAKEIKTHVVECFNNDPSSINALNNVKRINSWYNTRLEEFDAAFSAWVDREATRQGQTSGQIREIPIGQPLPEGFQYLNAEEEAKAKSGTQSGTSTATRPTRITSLLDFPHLRSLVSGDGAAVSSGPSVRGPGILGRRAGGRGDFTPIGLNPDRGYGKDGKEESTVDRALRIATRWQNIEKHIQKINAGSAPAAIKDCAIYMLGARVNRDVLLNMANNDIDVLFNFLLFRPHGTFKTQHGIKLALDGETGYMFYGNTVMMVATEAARMVGALHYTAYMSAVVQKAKNVIVAQDMFCKKYLGGHGTKFWTRDEYLKKSGSRRYERSIICTLLPPTFGDGGDNRLDKRMDVRGQWFTHYRNKLIETDRFKRILYPGADRTAAALHWWDPLRRGNSLDNRHRGRRIDINFVVHQGVQFHMNPKTEEWGDPMIEQGHLGPNVYAGSVKVLNGEGQFLRRPGYVGVSDARV